MPPVQANDKKLGLLLSSMSRNFMQAFAAGRFDEARRLALKASVLPRIGPGPLCDVAACAARLGLWDEAIDYAERALRANSNSLAVLDVLAHAWFEKDDPAKARYWGNLALSRRDAEAAGPAAANWAAPPPPPSAETRRLNIIAFSLFGNSAKYCEGAVLNAVEQSDLYPFWTCRVYVDETVPGSIRARLAAHGADVVNISDHMRGWPGPMWRFAACDIPGVHRVLFRDADSVISRREANAVGAWIASDRRFHHMRDHGSHVELLLAGLWGVIGGALPPMDGMVASFLAKPLASRHFADQYFLRQHVWPHARVSLLQHDSIFGFLDAVPFPDGSVAKTAHVGCNESAQSFEASTGLPDGTKVRWELRRSEPGGGEVTVCDYPAVVAGGAVRSHLPRRYAERLGKDMRIVIVPA